jgi:hypothetical protein
MTVQTDLNSGTPARVPDNLRRLEFGDFLAQFSGLRLRTLATTPALTIDTNDVIFPRPVLAIPAMTASVGGNNRPVVLIPDTSAVAAGAGGAAPGVHAAVVTRDAAGLITRVTFSGAPTIPFALVIEENTGAAAALAASEVA